ncbi:MAG TPA: VCBS repeat-containing protein [Sorangium sp.]|nr:VCBS repeat-containing protein [Sorangium sp.]
MFSLILAVLSFFAMKRTLGLFLPATLVLAWACGGDGNTSATTASGGNGSSASGGNGGTAAAGGSGQGGGSGGGVGFGGGGGCIDGQSCGDDGICAGGICCAADKACASQCCGDSDICSFQNCVTPGNDCTDSDDCPDGHYCEYALGDPTMGAGGGDPTCISGSEPPTGKCLPKPPICADNTDPGNPPSCLKECKFVPPTSTFNPTLKYSWGMEVTPPYASDIMMAPIVVQLDDDDCDGKISARDIPEIVFSTFQSGQYKGAGVTHAISIVDGQVVDKWSVSGVLHPTKQLAAGNIDGQPGNEVVGCGSDGTVKALDGAGNLLWSSPPLTCLMPSLADLDQDGDVEVIVAGAILDGGTGNIEHSFSAPVDSSLVVSDITGDGKLEVVTGSQAFDHLGQLLVDTSVANTGAFYGTPDWKSPWPAVADLDGDGSAEVIVVHNDSHSLSVWRYDATAANNFVIVRAPIDINGTADPAVCGTGWGATHGGGPPTVADFNGDGTPDVALAGGVGYAVFDGAKLMDNTIAGVNTFLWFNPTTDCSSASTGSTVFDFDGDGVAEVIYGDELMLRVYDGPTGNVLWETCNTTATLIENPVVADVDNDGHADLVAASNAYGKICDDGVTSRQSGIRIFGDATSSWVRTRRVWNQHAYHITNIEEDGTIPTIESVNYLQSNLNNFRLNKQPGGEFSAPDAVVSLAPHCNGDEYGLIATVQNLGEAALPANVPVGFYAGLPPNGILLGTLDTSRTLYSLDSESLTLPLPAASPDIRDGSTPVYAVVDDTTTAHPAWTECRTDNNTSDAVSGKCPMAN